jgi:hypothetical protein
VQLRIVDVEQVFVIPTAIVPPWAVAMTSFIIDEEPEFKTPQF